MSTYIALLRAVNVGERAELPMAELKAICEAVGFASVQTYIASGNVVFDSGMPAAQVKVALEQRLKAYAGKSVGVAVRTLAELIAVLDANPFANSAPSRTVAIFLDDPPPADALDHAAGAKDEAMRLGTREAQDPGRTHHGHGAQHEHHCQVDRNCRRTVGYGEDDGATCQRFRVPLVAARHAA